MMTERELIEPERIQAWRDRVTHWLHLARLDPDFRYAPLTADCHEPDDLVRQSWQLVHAGHRRAAADSFRAAIHYHPFNVSAWIGLSKVTESSDERRRLHQVALDLYLLIYEDQLRRGDPLND